MAVYGGVPGIYPEGDVHQVTMWFVASSKLSHRKRDLQVMFSERGPYVDGFPLLHLCVCTLA